MKDRRQAIGVGFLLLCLAAIPLTGAGWFSANRLGEIQSVQANAEAMDAQARELVDITILRALLLDERNWASASRGIAEIGITAELAEQFIGINLDNETANAAAGVDELIAVLELDDLAPQIEAIRSSTELGLEELAQEYNAIESPLALDAARQLDHMLDNAGDISGGEDIIRTLRLLDATADARQATASQLTQFFGVQFRTGDSTAELSRLIADLDQYEQSAADIRRIADDDSPTLQFLEQAQAEEEFAQLKAATQRIISSGFSTAGTTTTNFDLGSINELAATFNDGRSVSGTHLELVTVAGDEVLAASAQVQADARETTRQDIASIFVVAAASLSFAVALSSVIGRPMRRLARAAEKLRDGESVDDLKLRGPSELRAATRAISEASAHLSLAERQAMALADGDLDHPALGENTPGGLGESLQLAVQTLASSLNESQEFRTRLEHEARHDGLTNLPNRKACLVGLDEKLRQCKETKCTLATLFVDLDAFKATNDIHGHVFGDQVLVVVAERLRHLTAEFDGSVGRFGGDEFLVSMSPASGLDEVLDVAHRMRASISEPISLGSTVVTIDASIGIAMADPERHATADDVLWEADLAVHQAKSGGRGRVEVCDDALRARVEAHEVMTDRVREAIAMDHLTLFFQPIVRSCDGEVHNMEALVRWNATDGSMVYPDEFIPVAEASDLIVDLDRWVLGHATRQLASWAHDPLYQDLEVSINISSRHLASDHFVENIMGPIRANDVDPSQVVIEVTESALLEDRTDAAAKLEELRAFGVLVAIDDFGTGYTSLGHLRDLPVDILKIDRSFTDPASGSQSLVKLIVDAGHLLGARITAEGVETEEQARWLADMGADDLQGYLFARPCPPDDLNIRRARQQAITTLNDSSSAVS